MSKNEHDNSDLIRILIDIITSPSAGLGLVEAAAELIAEDARFNSWFYSRKGDSATAELWNMAALSQKHADDCARAWTGFRSAGKESRETSLRELVNLLHAQKTKLREIRETGVSDYRDPDMPPELLAW